jgi:hypothetical protein
MNSHMFSWPEFLQSVWHRLYWWVMTGTVIEVPHKEGELVVDHDHPLWYDVSAVHVVVWTDDPEYFYGPWLTSMVGRKNIDWCLITRVAVTNTQGKHGSFDYEKSVFIRFRRGKEHLATMAKLMWA